MKNMFKILSLVVGIAGAFAQTAHSAANLKGDAQAGEKHTVVCAACHGKDGNSPAPTFPKIAGLGEKYILKQLMAIRNMNGEFPKAPVRQVAVMTGLLDAKSDQDLADIAAYYDSQQLQISGAKKASVTLNSGQTVDALKYGEQLFRAGDSTKDIPACTGCHSPKGLGNKPAGFPRLSGQYSEYIAKQLKDYRSGTRQTDGDTMIMRGVAKNLSDAQIDAVANYISGLN